MKKLLKKVQRASGKVSRRIGLNFSEESRLALLKKKQDREMAKTGEKTMTKQAMEYVFCMVNERELFTICTNLIEQFPQQTNGSRF